MTANRSERALLTLSALVGVVAFLAVLAVGRSPAESAFPGANGKIAFQSDRDGNQEVYVMNADGSGQTNLTNNPTPDHEPAWSPDGTKIAFVTGRDGNDEIYVMNADGTGQTNLTNNPASDGAPAWSPDGTKIAFASLGNGDVFVMNADGSGQSNLTNNPGFDTEPAWSPDGTKIAFSSARDGNFEVYVMNADGSGQSNLTNNPEPNLSPGANWSPDGTKIAFSSARDNPSQSEVYVMNADGSGQTNLTNVLSIFDGRPAWSPDGTKIAFASNRGPNPLPTEIFVMNADGSGQTGLTNNAATDVEPDWQPLVYSFTGFFSPVNNLPTLNAARAGSAVPVKFSLNGDQGLDIFATGYPRSQRMDCDTSAPLDTVEETVTAGSSSLSYDAVADQYVYVWKTDKAWAGTCRQLMVRLNDLTEHVANFKFK